VPEGLLEIRRIPRVALHTLRRVPLISSRTASLRPLPSWHFCLLPSPGPRSTGVERSGRSPMAEASGCWPGAVAGRSPLWRATPPQAEAVGGAHNLRRPRPSQVPCGSAGRGRWFRSVPPRPKPGQLGLLPPEGVRDRSRLIGDRGRLASPEGPAVPPPTEVDGGGRRAPRCSGGVGEPVPCLGDAPIRRSGPPRHQTGHRSSRQAGRIRPDIASLRGPKASGRDAPWTSLQELVGPV
jgi:hypothetical protein